MKVKARCPGLEDNFAGGKERCVSLYGGRAEEKAVCLMLFLFAYLPGYAFGQAGTTSKLLRDGSVAKILLLFDTK